MKKTAMCTAVFLLVLVFCGCSFFITEIETGRQDPASEYSYVTGSQTVPTAATEAPGTLPSTEESASVYTTEPTTVYIPLLPSVSESTAIRPTESSAAVPMETTSASVPQSTALPDGDVDLSIQLPEANGTMEVSLDPSNRFIKAVHDSRGISVSLLAAVYAVPESGQNYVFEFTSEKDRTADALRRVYLLDASGAITSVAASNGSERENLSATENWFCMNVLIKGMVLPAVQDELS